MGAPPNGSPLFLITGFTSSSRVFGPAISRNAGYCITVFSGLVSEGSSVKAHRGVRLNPALSSSIQEITASGEIGGARVGKPRHSRIPRMASGEWMAARILMRPRQRWHSRTSTSQDQFSYCISCSRTDTVVSFEGPLCMGSGSQYNHRP